MGRFFCIQGRRMQTLRRRETSCLAFRRRWCWARISPTTRPRAKDRWINWRRMFCWKSTPNWAASTVKWSTLDACRTNNGSSASLTRYPIPSHSITVDRLFGNRFACRLGIDLFRFWSHHTTVPSKWHLRFKNPKFCPLFEFKMVFEQKKCFFRSNFLVKRIFATANCRFLQTYNGPTQKHRSENFQSLE